MRKMLDKSYTQNRELSWLRFNERVLEEASDPAVPLFERLKFCAIYTSNLDEFFMVRVGSLFELSQLKDNTFDNKSFLKPSEQLEQIFTAVHALAPQRDIVFQRIESLLAHAGIQHTYPSRLSSIDRSFLTEYFQENVFPILSPQIIDLHHPFPHLTNKKLYIAVLLKTKKKCTLGIIPIPDAVPRLIRLPGRRLRYVLSEDLLLMHIADIFSMYSIIDKGVICVTRNADISPDDEAPELGEDYLQHMRSTLKKRNYLTPVRLELQTNGDSLLTDYLRKRIQVKKEQVYPSAAPLDLSYVFDLENLLSSRKKQQLLYVPFTPQKKIPVPGRERILNYVQKKDLLLSYPYQSFDRFLQLIREAAYDKNVLSIKITIYRLGRSRTKLMNYLITAADNGKDVTVLMELKARFDEANNILWAENLQEAGCHIIYGFDGYKVHSKICLITRRVNSHLCYTTQIGTGNYNARTAAMYTDLSLITSDKTIGHDADVFFKNMGIGNLDGCYQRLLVAPTGLKSGLLRLITEEKEKAQAGQKAHILLKMNSLTDRELIDALQAAATAGVRIDLIVRGICCLLPAVPGKTENIHIKSIVGRFLEHSRIFCFGAEPLTRKIYISSADWMTRNTENRVEIACPIQDVTLRAEIMQSLQTMLADNVKGRCLNADGSYCREPAGEQPVDSQQYFIDQFSGSIPTVPLGGSSSDQHLQA